MFFLNLGICILLEKCFNFKIKVVLIERNVLFNCCKELKKVLFLGVNSEILIIKVEDISIVERWIFVNRFCRSVLVFLKGFFMFLVLNIGNLVGFIGLFFFFYVMVVGKVLDVVVLLINYLGVFVILIILINMIVNVYIVNNDIVIVFFIIDFDCIVYK